MSACRDARIHAGESLTGFDKVIEELNKLRGKKMKSEFLRCEITENPCGSDTWLEGTCCHCDSCRKWVMRSWGQTIRELQNLKESFMESMEGQHKIEIMYQKRIRDLENKLLVAEGTLSLLEELKKDE